MSTSTEIITSMRLVDQALETPSIARRIEEQLGNSPNIVAVRAAVREEASWALSRFAVSVDRPVDADDAKRAVIGAVTWRWSAFQEGMAVLDERSTRAYVSRSVPTAQDADDVLGDAQARLWRSMTSGRVHPERAGAYAMGIAKLAVADWWRAAGRRPATISVTDEDGVVMDLVDLAGARALEHLQEVEALHRLLADLRALGATDLELERLMAFVLAEGDARRAVKLLKTPCRPGTLNQSITSLRARLARSRGHANGTRTRAAE